MLVRKFHLLNDILEHRKLSATAINKLQHAAIRYILRLSRPVYDKEGHTTQDYDKRTRTVRTKMVTGHKELRCLAKEYDCFEDVIKWRYDHLDYSQYVLRFWRAIAAVSFQNKNIDESCVMFQVEKNDVFWVLDNLDVKDMEDFRRLMEEYNYVIEVPIQFDMVTFIRDIKPYCNNMAKRYLSFIANHDPCQSIENFVNDLIVESMRMVSIYISKNIFDVAQIKGLALKSIYSSTMKIAAYYGHPDRNRIRRVDGSDEYQKVVLSGDQVLTQDEDCTKTLLDLASEQTIDDSNGHYWSKVQQPDFDDDFKSIQVTVSTLPILEQKFCWLVLNDGQDDVFLKWCQEQDINFDEVRDKKKIMLYCRYLGLNQNQLQKIGLTINPEIKGYLAKRSQPKFKVLPLVQPTEELITYTKEDILRERRERHLRLRNRAC